VSIFDRPEISDNSFNPSEGSLGISFFPEGVDSILRELLDYDPEDLMVGTALVSRLVFAILRSIRKEILVN